MNQSRVCGIINHVIDPSKIHALGWHHQVEIEEGIARLYDWYLNQDEAIPRMQDK